VTGFETTIELFPRTSITFVPAGTPEPVIIAPTITPVIVARLVMTAEAIETVIPVAEAVQAADIMIWPGPLNPLTTAPAGIPAPVIPAPIGIPAVAEE
jgi:hypothetical protein